MSVLLIYDGACRFCRFGIDIVRTLDVTKALGFCPFGEDEAERHLEELPEPERHDVFHAYKDDVLYSGTDAARVTLEALPLGFIPVALGLHNLYPLLANNRGIFGRFVPDRAAANTCSRARQPST